MLPNCCFSENGGKLGGGTWEGVTEHLTRRVLCTLQQRGTLLGNHTSVSVYEESRRTEATADTDSRTYDKFRNWVIVTREVGAEGTTGTILPPRRALTLHICWEEDIRASCQLVSHLNVSVIIHACHGCQNQTRLNIETMHKSTSSIHVTICINEIHVSYMH